MEVLTKRLTDFREKNDLSQEAMAALLGIKYRTYQTIEKTGQVKKVADLEKINAKIGVGDTQKSVGEPGLLPMHGGKTDDFQSLYVAQLKENAELYKKLIQMSDDLAEVKQSVKQLQEVKQLVEQNSVSLAAVERHQMQIAALNSAFRKMFSDYVGKQSDHDPKTLLRTLHRDAVQKMKEFARTDNLLQIDT